MPTHLVNLDALIIREDFKAEAINSARPGSKGQQLKLAELGSESIVSKFLRKPDFQRETSSWKPKTVMELIKSFLDGDLIPSVILWQSPDTGNIFVIDGSHRLSALIAWVRDDYGDRATSEAFFEGFIPKEQREAADKTRNLVKKFIGSYAKINQAGLNPGNASAVDLRRAQNASVLSIDLQWVNGDATKAEESFFKINQQAAPIHPTELRVLKSRKKPNALATRALIHAGVGHNYWSAFPLDAQNEIKRKARNIYDILFDPPIAEPVKTLDLPIAGRGYSVIGFQTIFEVVNLANKCSDTLPKDIPDDTNGSATVEFLKSVERIANRFSGMHSGSLGLHPVIYTYSATARFQPAAFLAVVLFLEYLHHTDGFFSFTEIRGEFEDFLVKHRFFVNQIVRKFGSSTKASPKIYEMYLFLFSELKDKKSESQILADLNASPDFSFLKEGDEYEKAESQDAGIAQKNAGFIQNTIGNAPKCNICQARIHLKGITFDHKLRQQDGGSGDSQNIQPTHPYCNTGYKERLVSLGRWP